MRLNVIFLSIFLSIFLLGFVSSEVYTCSNYADGSSRILGDVDGNGIVDNDDSMIVLGLAADTSSVEGDDFCIDVDGDSDISLDDFSIILDAIDSGVSVESILIEKGIRLPSVSSDSSSNSGSSSSNNDVVNVVNVNDSFSGDSLGEDVGFLPNLDEDEIVEDSSEGSNIWIYLGAIFVVILILGLILFIYLRKKKVNGGSTVSNQPPVSQMPQVDNSASNQIPVNQAVVPSVKKVVNNDVNSL